MKKSILLFGYLLLNLYCFSQADIANPVFGHQRTNVRYLGWTPGPGSILGPLDIRNDFNAPIQLFTNNIQRIHINQNVFGPPPT